ncbi:uncharacterized protein CC84DRAFT_1167962 [Paraphaeosphaeria sporulosa]|uniref:Uncharacterized protein n=1 Tax=Paraphaeosphaeria sporulosa TaxID=1460663 RepID=A0A177C342_9PLEO|nr:uncharacterized protein CC84DRAFT_1167962 [Paraphaeosphaeria sporulosa]OAG01816.1 hypothetical protein CC84DRAFT_1167962 [Paraphaeosphaeria sporulosa]
MKAFSSDHQGYELTEIGSSPLLEHPSPRRTGKIRNVIRRPFSDFKKDVASIQWGRDLGLFVWLGGMISGLTFLGLSTYSTSVDACSPDGEFTLWPGDFNYWHSSNFFQINFGFGRLTFAQAKAIDVVWDVVVGRAGQALLAIVSWQVFARYLTTSMGIQPVTFNTFSAIFLHNEPTIMSLFRISRDFTTRQRLRSKIAMIFMLVTMGYILAFPTIASAMTGYNGNVAAFVPDSSGNFVKFESFQPVLYVIHDGDRINKTKDFAVTPFASGHNQPYLTHDSINGLENDNFYMAGSLASADAPAYYFAWNVSLYVETYGFLGLGSANSTDGKTKFLNQTLESPPLNISAYYIPAQFSHYWFGPVFYGYDYRLNDNYPFRDPRNMRWTWEQQVVNYTYVENSAQCQATKDFQWGFSFLQLFIATAWVFVWSIGMFTMWLKTHKLRSAQDQHEIAGEYKAILQLASAIHDNFQSCPEGGDTNPNRLTESDLKNRINKVLKGGVIMYQKPPDVGQVNFWEVFRQWLAREKWWIPVCLVVLTFMGTGFMLEMTFWIWSFGPGVGIIWAMSFCSTLGSRLLMVVLWSLLFLVVALSLRLAISL